MSVKIGVIIPSYNQGKYIEAAIRSAAANKKHADVHIAVIDGGSQDETLSIIKKYEKELDVWRSEPDGGQADAINKGIRALPDCQYYLWLNSDDAYEDEHAVQKIAEFAVKNEYQVCYGLSHFIDEKGKIIGEYPVEPYHPAALGQRCYLSQPSVMFSKKAYAEVGEINTNLKMCLDYEYWIRLSRKYEFGFLSEYIGCTRMYGDTKTATMQQRHLQEAICILMKYYGDVPMHWIVTEVLAEHPGSLLGLLPRRLLLVLLRPMKRSVINKCLKGDIYAEDSI